MVKTMTQRLHKAHVVDTKALPERRGRQRTRRQLKADVTLPGDLTIVGHTLDISSSGLSIDVPYELETGQRCEIELDLSKVGGPKWVQVMAEVKRCTLNVDDHFQAGLQFVDLDATLIELLDAFIWARIKK
jgi:hypothetical protein